VILDVVQPLLLSWMNPNFLLQHFGQSMFWLSLLIVFVECGLFFPVLPGDTLLFAMGIFLATDEIKIFHGGHHLDLPAALLLFSLAAFLGNVSGYEIGRLIGPPLAQRDGRILKKKYFDQTSEFFDKHGNKALMIGRFVPFVRTYITVVAGIGRMDRRRFALWSAVGAVLWVLAVTLLGYFLGKRFPGLAGRIDKAILVLLVLTVVPLAFEWWRRRRHQHAERREAAVAAARAPESTRS